MRTQPGERVVQFGVYSRGFTAVAHNAGYIQRPLRGSLLLRRLAGRQR